MIRANPYAFMTFMALYVALSAILGLMTESFVFFGLLLLFIIPFVLLAMVFWVVMKAFVRSLFSTL